MASVSVTRAVAEAIRDAAQSVEGVAGLSSGRFGEAILRVPGTLIEGIKLVDAAPGAGQPVSHLAVYVIYDLSSRRAIPEIVTDVQDAVLAIPAVSEGTGIDRVDVVVADAR